MSIQLDHLSIPVRDRNASAELLATILGVPWAKSGVGPFSPVYVSDGLTIDFDQAESAYPVLHYCFRVSDEEFDSILSRIKNHGLVYRSTPNGPDDARINTDHGGRIVYWKGPDIHYWEMLTHSYDRQKR
jgi:catechol 2,3-dioxygenase-like lactoylglutathione lyase family enzyme